jgi:hypothetical protein
MDCLFVQCTLAKANHSCWLLRWIKALCRVQPFTLEGMGDLTNWPPSLADSLKAIRAAATGSLDDLLWDYGDPLDTAPCQHRKIALHYRCLRHGKWGAKSWYLWCDVPEQVWRSWVCLTSCSANVPARAQIQSGIAFANRLCKKCTMGIVANEHHVLLICPATESVRHTFRTRLHWPRQPDLMFLQSNRTHTCIVFAHVSLHVYNAKPDVA